MKTLKNDQKITNSLQNQAPESEIFGVFNSLKQIEPDKAWKNTTKTQLFTKIEAKEEAKQPKYVVRKINWMPTKPAIISLATAGLMVLGVFGVQAISPLSAFYPLKENLSNAVYSLLPVQKQITQRLSLANEKAEALQILQSQSNPNSRKIASLNQSLEKDLSLATAGIHKLQNPKQVVALSANILQATDKLEKIALQIPAQSSANASSSQNNLALNKLDKKATVTTEVQKPSPINKAQSQNPEPQKDIQKLVQQTKNEILAVITESQDKVNNCPEYLSQKLNNLLNSEDNAVFNPAKYPEILVLLKDAKKYLEANDCVEALVNLDKVESLKLKLLIQPSAEIKSGEGSN